MPLADWLTQANGQQRRRAIVQVARQLRLVHQAGYRFRSTAQMVAAFVVSSDFEHEQICLRSASDLVRGEPSRRQTRLELRRLAEQAGTITPLEGLRFLLAYLGDEVSAGDVRAWVDDIMPSHPRGAARARNGTKLTEEVVSA
jgi:hypothetical protein